MSEPNYAGNIIVSLANLPEFLRRPILQKRLSEFFTMQEQDRQEIINNALQAGPTIQFDRFAKLFKTWLEVLCDLPEEHRTIMFRSYVAEIARRPDKIIAFNLDGIFGVYLMLTKEQQGKISESVRKIVSLLDGESRRRISLIVPEMAKKELGI